MRRILWAGILAGCLAGPALPGEPTLPTRPAAHPATGVAPPKHLPDVVDDSSAPPGQPVASATLPRALRRAVIADAARRFQVPASAVVLIRAERVTWPDGSLGCPAPGHLYTQALVPGYRLVAKTAQGELTYHTDSRGNIAACARTLESPREALRKLTPVDPVTGPPEAPPDR